MHDPILQISDLHKRFSSVEALKGISFQVERGSITGILGPNGAGKTTLLRIINAILLKDQGHVLLDGREINLEVARTIGYMPEERGLYDKMTVEEQILYFGRLKGGDTPRLRVVMEEYLDLFNIATFKKRRIKELSKGNQQKVQIVATLVHEPSLVVLDEPFSGFDPINGAILQQLIDRLHQRNATILLSSHNMAAIEDMCSDIVLIDHGQLLLNGSIADIKQSHKTREIHLTTSAPLSIEMAMTSGLLEHVREIPTAKWRQGHSYSLLKKDGVSNSSVLNELTIQSEIIQFEETLPSLNDLFIQYTLHRASEHQAAPAPALVSNLN